tara:strand:+ start:137 stop:724 length:588 start_codon:yes stop_codon:yes gene_type:complete
MSWRKIVLCAIPLIILFSIIFIVSEGQNDKSEVKIVDELKTNNHENMSYSELSLIAVQHDYKSLLRNIDNYSGKIIFVEGEVMNLEREWIKLSDGTIVDGAKGQYLKDSSTQDLLGLCVDESNYFLTTSNCDEIMFLDVNGISTWLENDKLSGYVEVMSLEEVFYNNMGTGAGNTGSSEDYVPQIKQMKLRCSNC